MSPKKKRRTGKHDRMCKVCGQRKALHRTKDNKTMRWSPDHDLCHACFSAELDREHAAQKAARKRKRKQRRRSS
jgi:hypothetical protein